MIDIKIILIVILSYCHYCHIVIMYLYDCFSILLLRFLLRLPYFLNVAHIYCPILHTESCFYIDIQHIGYRGAL